MADEKRVLVLLSLTGSFSRNVKGREYVDTDGFFRKCGTIGKTLGLCE